jgi:signal transduction histidine kinase
MRTPIQVRLTLTTLAVLLLGMGIAALLAWLAVEQLFLATQGETLLVQAQLTASALEGVPLPTAPGEPYTQTSNVQPGIHTRLLGEQGAVVVNLPITADDAPVQVPMAENTSSISPNDLLQRPEIQSALQGTPATFVRKVASANNRRVLYAAAPVYSESKNIVGIAYLATPLPPTNLPANIIFQLIGAIAIAVLLAGTAGAFLSRRIALPLKGLVRAATAVADGDLSQRVPTDENILELHSLGEAFNNMTSNLLQSDQAKKAFVADVTHELRTPLTVINGTIETLEDGALDDIEGRGPLLASMQKETNRLIRLVNDLLVLTRAEAGALNLNIVSLNLVELAHARCESLYTLAAPRRVVLQVKAQDPAIVRGDEDRLSQVLDNLLDNAIRHAPDGSAVTVIIQHEENEISCAVSDQGSGIPVQHLPLIFERFYRVDTSRARHTGGTGLGLAIVQSLVSAQGGRITINSVEGMGTTITFWLPADENCHLTA